MENGSMESKKTLSSASSSIWFAVIFKHNIPNFACDLLAIQQMIYNCKFDFQPSVYVIEHINLYITLKVC